MSKAILVMDMPEECEECILYSGYNCMMPGERKRRENKRPRLCPLRELPKKKKYHDGTFNGVVKGWNLCIDEILKN